MTIFDDIADLIAAQIDEISLHLANDSEVTGSGYTRLSPSYAAASDGTADLDAPLEFSGPNGTTPTQYGNRLAGGDLWGDLIPIDDPQPFNSDNRLNLVSAAITIDAATLAVAAVFGPMVQEYLEQQEGFAAAESGERDFLTTYQFLRNLEAEAKAKAQA